MDLVIHQEPKNVGDGDLLIHEEPERLAVGANSTNAEPKFTAVGTTRECRRWEPYHPRRAGIVGGDNEFHPRRAENVGAGNQLIHGEGRTEKSNVRVNGLYV